MCGIERHYGICRTVYLVGPWAIKFPRLHWHELSIERRVWSWTRGVQANLSERDFSESDGVAPVLRSLFGLVNVYPRCEPWPSDRPGPDYDTLGPAWLARDRKPDNVGLLNGEPVWLDYDGSWNGCPHTPANYVSPTTEGQD